MDASDPPEPPLSKGKGGFKGKRTKRLAYQRKKGAKRQKTSPSPPPPRADEDHTQTNQVTEHAAFPAVIPEPEQFTSAQKSYKYMTKAEVVSELTECQRELVAARAEIVSRDKKITHLTTNCKVSLIPKFS